MTLRNQLTNDDSIYPEDAEEIAIAVDDATTNLKVACKLAERSDHPAVYGGLTHLIRRLELFAKSTRQIGGV